jgi:hypothetical protein
MVVGRAIELRGPLILVPLMALISLGFAVWVVARAPWPRNARLGVIVAAVALGFAPIVWLVSLFVDLGHALGGLGT